MSHLQPTSVSGDAAKRRLFEQMLRARGIAAGGSRSIPRHADGQPIPLSSSQQRLWILEQLYPGGAAYNDVFAVRLSGRLDPEILKQALEAIVHRHEPLRTEFAAINGRPVQRVVPEVPVVLAASDLRASPADGRNAELEALGRDEVERPFDLGAAPLWRLRLVRTADDEHVLFLTVHHIVSDGVSFVVFVRELVALYDALVTGRPSPLADLPLRYADYAAWEQGRLEDPSIRRQLAFWKDDLAPRLPRTRLPIDYSRPSPATFRGRGLPLPLSPALVLGLEALARSEGATLFMAIAAAYRALLLCHTGQDDTLIGFTVANRNRRELEDLFGMFVNTLPLRVDVSGDPQFRELLRRSRDRCLGAYAHQEAPFNKLVDELRTLMGPKPAPLFDAYLLQETVPPPVRITGLTVRPLVMPCHVAKFDLELWLVDERETGKDPGTTGPVWLRLQYNLDLFGEATMARLLQGLEAILTLAVSQPDVRLSELQAEYERVGRRQQATSASHRKSATAQSLRGIRRKPLSEPAPGTG